MTQREADTLPEVPTLNPEYNYLILIAWPRATGNTYKPECEECECDLTGKKVIEVGGWRCESCAESYDPPPSYREDFHADG